MASRANATKPLTHIECLQKLCIICYEKGQLDDISENLKIYIEEMDVIKNVLAVHNPTKICSSCRQDLQTPNGPEIAKNRRALKQPSIDELGRITLHGVCECKICQIVKANKPPSRKKKSGRPKKISNSLICGKCMDPNCNGINCEKPSTVKESAKKVIENNPRMA